MSKRTIIHLLLRILLVPAVPFFVMVYLFQGLENDRHGIKLMICNYLVHYFVFIHREHSVLY